MTMVEAKPAHPARSGLQDAIVGVDEAAVSALYGLTDTDLEAAFESCEQLRAHTYNLQLDLVREADGRNLGRRLGAASTAAWLSARYRLQPGHARRMVHTANASGEAAEPVDYAANVSSRRTGRELTQTVKALADGHISPEHVTIVDKVMSKIPTEVGAEQAAKAEEDLAGFCREFDPGTVAKLGDYLLEMLRADTLDDDEHDRQRRRYLRLDEQTGRVTGQLTREQLAMLHTALDPLAAPAPADDGTPDERSPGQRLCDALAELARRAIASDSFENNHGISHRVMVTIGLDALLAAGGEWDAETSGDDDMPDGDGTVDTSTGADTADSAHTEQRDESITPFTSAPATGAPAEPGGPFGLSQPDATGLAGGGIPPAHVQWGSLLSASAVKRLACCASVQRIVLDPAGAVLDVGRDYRTVTPAQFAALIARDGGCAFPGCTRPPAWCIAHHIKHWAHGGTTNLDNLVLLCGHHHQVIHHHGWEVHVSRADRLPTFTPPRWVDPDRTPRRNKRRAGHVRGPTNDRPAGP